MNSFAKIMIISFLQIVLGDFQDSVLLQLKVESTIF
jgi:hypothetical protein